MQSKSTTNQANPQPMIAGILKSDKGIEFFGIRATKEVFWLQNGASHPFCELKGSAAAAVIEAYEEDGQAKAILNEIRDNEGKLLPYARKVELYVYYCYGEIDATPDLQDGKLSLSENFRHAWNCVSLGFERKKLRLNGHVLKAREIVMIDLFSKDTLDTVVAEELNIAVSTFDQHKREFLQKTGVITKTALMIAATQQNLVL